MGRKKNKITISEYVKEKRKEMGLTIYDFADRFHISHSLVSQYEFGSKDNPSLAIAAKFCKVFGISAEDFISDFQYQVFTINDTFETIVSLQCRIDGYPEKRNVPDLDRFLAKFSEYNTITDFRIFDDDEKNGVFPYTMATRPSAKCKLNNKNTCIIYFPYRSTPDNQRDTKLTYYKDYINAISEILLHENLPFDFFVLLTTDRAAFSFIEELKKAYIKDSRKNITVVCNQYKKYSGIMIFSGESIIHEGEK